MVITTTAIGFILLGLGVAFCGWRFLRAFRKVSSPSGKFGLILSAFFFASALQNGILGIGALFSAYDSNGLYSVILLSHLFLVLMALISTYMAFYTLFPNQSFVLPMLLVGILGTIFISLTIVLHPQPVLTLQHGIDWDINSPLSLIMFVLFFAGFAPPAYIFWKIFRKAISKELKRISFVIAVLCLGGIFNVFTRLIILQGGSTALRTRLLDIGVVGIGAVFVIISLTPWFFRSYSTKRNINAIENSRIYNS